MNRNRRREKIGRGKQSYFPRQPRCRICKKKIEFGDLCYYCRKRRTS